MLEILANEIRQEKKIQGIQTGMEEIKLPIFLGDMITHFRKFQGICQKTDKLIREYRRSQDMR